MTVLRLSPDRLKVLLEDLSCVRNQLKTIDERLVQLTGESAELVSDSLVETVILKINRHNAEEQIRLDLIDYLISHMKDVIGTYEETEKLMADSIMGIEDVIK